MLHSLTYFEQSGNGALSQREPTVRRPPSMDYKPRRSESEDPGKGPFTVVKSIRKSDGTVITETTKTVKVRVGLPNECMGMMQL